jgi:glycine dehydrogenase subunit 1
VAAVNDALRERGIFGGASLARELPTWGETSLFCFTEVHGTADIDRLVAELREVLA